jgi:hypothetical protein
VIVDVILPCLNEARGRAAIRVLRETA